MSERSIKYLVDKLPFDQQDDFEYFLKNVHTGGFDDAESVVLNQFYRWRNKGAIRRSNPGTDKRRVFVDVPFPKKDSFKASFMGKWDPNYKCWYVTSKVVDIGSISDSLSSAGYHLVVIMDEKTDKIHAVYNASLAKSRFSSADFGSTRPTSTIYQG